MLTGTGLPGACAGFSPYNLARPSRIFMGDGGSMLLGTLVAACAMAAAPATDLGAGALVAGALIAGVAILDTTLVSVSRRRGGRPLLAGGRDHLTHRLACRLDSPERVAAVLAGGQVALCAVAVACATTGPGWVLSAGALAAGAGLLAVAALESPAWAWLAPTVAPAAPSLEIQPAPTVPAAAGLELATPELALASGASSAA